MENYLIAIIILLSFISYHLFNISGNQIKIHERQNTTHNLLLYVYNCIRLKEMIRLQEIYFRKTLNKNGITDELNKDLYESITKDIKEIETGIYYYPVDGKINQE